MNKLKVAVVTGVASGIGKTTAELLSIENWYVIGIDLGEKLNISWVDSYFSTDLSNPEEVFSLFKKISILTDHIDALINNAAYQICKPIIETSINEWDKTMDTNVRAAFLLIKEGYTLIKKCKGCIVNVSSVHAVATSSNIASYAASKGALTSFTRALAVEFGKDEIRVNSVLPGATDTPMLEAGLKRGHLSGNDYIQLKEDLAKKTVLNRIGTTDEISQMILFLVSSQKSSFITGQCFVVDGGATARLSTE